MPIATGTKLGSYEVQEFIGQGAMGFVYRAYHAQLERSGAVKVLQGIAADPDAAARFRHEAQAIAQMRHPNIVNVFDFGDFEGTPYMIVEYVPGGNLAGRIQEAPPDQATTLKYLRGIGAGLDYAHSLGIVHRDVKPANVLLEKDGTPVLADFGLVKLLQGSSLKSMTGVTTGTPAYMAPEQVTGHQVGPPADRYALATMAYEMLTGSIPFEGEGVLELLYAHVHREPPPPSSRNPALGAYVDAVILRGLAKDPAARWESCSAFVDALSAALAGVAPPVAAGSMVPEPVAATRPMVVGAIPIEAPAARLKRASTAATVAMAMPAGRAPSMAPTVEGTRSRKRLYQMVAGAVILLLLLIAGVILVAANQKPTLSLNPAIAVPGERVTVTATHLPANQVGDIELRSSLHTFPFQANGSGDVSKVILIPADIGIADHSLSLCWGGSCHLQKTLRVVSVVGLATPTPSAGASGTPTASARPSSSPGASPTPSPRQAFIEVSPTSGKANTPVTVYGLNFSPGQSVNIDFIQGSTQYHRATGVIVSTSGTFVHAITIPLLALRGQATIQACGGSRCASATFTVVLL